MIDERTQLIDHVVAIREGLKRGDYKNEAAISDGVVKRLLEAVGWPRYDQRIVFPQFPVENRKADFALCYPAGEPVVLLEVKALGEADDKAEQQLFGYCYKKHVKIGILTDGSTWKLYYPHGEGGFVDRLFCRLDLLEGEQTTIAEALQRYLAYDAVISGEAVERSRATYVNYQWQSHFSTVWDSLLRDPDPNLVNLFRRRVNEESGSRPDKQEVVSFLRQQGQGESKTILEPAPPDQPTPIAEDTNSPFCTLNGVTIQCKTAKDVFVVVFSELAKRDATFCERYARTQRTGGKRLELARRAEDLYPPGSKWARMDASRLPGGWWMATHLSNELKEQRIQRACDVAGIQYGRDLIVSLSR